MHRRPHLARAARAGALGAVLASLSLAATPVPAPRPAGTSRGAARHLHLVKSEPAANDTLHAAPTAIRLWFTERPELAVTSIRLASAAGVAVALGPVTADTAATAPIAAPVRGHLAPGAYVATWRATADDGHPGTGTIPFVIAGH
jgi:methionine-rich copper-binding protein CopC